MAFIQLFGRGTRSSECGVWSAPNGQTTAENYKNPSNFCWWVHKHNVLSGDKEKETGEYHLERELAFPDDEDYDRTSKTYDEVRRVISLLAFFTQVQSFSFTFQRFQREGLAPKLCSLRWNRLAPLLVCLGPTLSLLHKNLYIIFLSFNCLHSDSEPLLKNGPKQILALLDCGCGTGNYLPAVVHRHWWSNWRNIKRVLCEIPNEIPLNRTSIARHYGGGILIAFSDRLDQPQQFLL